MLSHRSSTGRACCCDAALPTHINSTVLLMTLYMCLDDSCYVLDSNSSKYVRMLCLFSSKFLHVFCLLASSSYCPSAGGDDRSISGSSDTSDTSQSDCSIGSRLTIWPDSTSNQPESVSHAGAKAVLHNVEKLSVNQGVGGRPAAKPPRHLQEIGRQSSSDSGIATASHSSYSGSFSSYTGSLDITPGEDFGSVFSLPPHLAQDLSPCTCPVVSGHEYLVPTSLRYLYDTPRSVLQEGGGDVKDSETSTPTKDNPASSGLSTDSTKGVQTCVAACASYSETTEPESVSEHFKGLSEESKKTKMAPSSDHPDSCHICSSKTIVTICSACGGFKVSLHTEIM